MNTLNFPVMLATPDQEKDALANFLAGSAHALTASPICMTDGTWLSAFGLDHFDAGPLVDMPWGDATWSLFIGPNNAIVKAAFPDLVVTMPWPASWPALAEVPKTRRIVFTRYDEGATEATLVELMLSKDDLAPITIVLQFDKTLVASIQERLVTNDANAACQLLMGAIGKPTFTD